MAAVLTSEWGTLLTAALIQCDVEKYIQKIFRFLNVGLNHTFILQKAAK